MEGLEEDEAIPQKVAITSMQCHRRDFHFSVFFKLSPFLQFHVSQFLQLIML